MKNWIASMETRIDALGAKLEKKEIQYPLDLTAGILCMVASIVLLLILPTQYHAQPDEVMDGDVCFPNRERAGHHRPEEAPGHENFEPVGGSEGSNGSVEGIAAAEAANSAVTGTTQVPLLTLGIPGDGCVAIMLSALMINSLNPGLSLFTTDGPIMYAIMIGLIFVNIFMQLQGQFFTNLFAKIVSVPQEILTPVIIMFCFAGAFSVNKNYFDVGVILVFGAMAWLFRKIEIPAVPILLGMVLGAMSETNFRRALMISDGSPSIFFGSVFCWVFIILIAVVLATVALGVHCPDRPLSHRDWLLPQQHHAALQHQDSGHVHGRGGL